MSELDRDESERTARAERARPDDVVFGYEVTASPWSEIAAFFRWIVEGGGEWAQPMLNLVEQIGASPHADRLFAITSMHTVIVAATTPFHMSTEVLRIDYDLVRGDFAFEFVEQPAVHTRWRKRCPPDEAFGAVVHLAQVKGWIPAAMDEDGG